MSDAAKKKGIPGKVDVPAATGDDLRKAKKEKQLQPVKDQKQESEAIERAVYDGMLDLRAKKSS